MEPGPPQPSSEKVTIEEIEENKLQRNNSEGLIKSNKTGIVENVSTSTPKSDKKTSKSNNSTPKTPKVLEMLFKAKSSTKGAKIETTENNINGKNTADTSSMLVEILSDDESYKPTQENKVDSNIAVISKIETNSEIQPGLTKSLTKSKKSSEEIENKTNTIKNLDKIKSQKTLSELSKEPISTTKESISQISKDESEITVFDEGINQAEQYPKEPSTMEVDDEDNDDELSEQENSISEGDTSVASISTPNSNLSSKLSNLQDVNNTPKKPLTPKQLQKRLDSEKKRLAKQKEREEQKRLKEEEKMKKVQEKFKLKQEKEEQKKKELEQKQKEKEAKEEQKRKEKEEKELKRKEKEEKEEQKRKEREQEKIKRQQEIDEKNKEKQKQEEQKQKAKAVFANFFTKKSEKCEQELRRTEDQDNLAFMPFEVKSDMRLAPIVTRILNDKEKNDFIKIIEEQEGKTYLEELKEGKIVGKRGKTWTYEEENSDDVMILEENLGQTIDEQKPKLTKMRAKFFKFHENQRPPYYGTWRKRSKLIKPTTPFKVDTIFFDYEVDSDDEWEDEGEGESLKGSDDEEKEESDNEYEVDNEVFVPHGHLSDDEVDDEENARLSPESHKAKLKLLKNEFDEEMKSQTKKIKPRLIGCVWYDKNHAIAEEAIHRYLEPFTMLTNGQIVIRDRENNKPQHENHAKYTGRQLDKELVPEFLKLIHGSKRKRKILVEEFLNYLDSRNLDVNLSKNGLSKQLKQFATWMKNPVDQQYCWCVHDDVQKEYELNLNAVNS